MVHLIRCTVLTLLEDYHLFKKDNAQLQVSILIKNTIIKVHKDNLLNTTFFKKMFLSYFCPFHFKVTFLFQSLVILPTCLGFQNCHSMFPNLLLYIFQQEITILQKAPYIEKYSSEQKKLEYSILETEEIHVIQYTS